jgi:hypothetical protein
MRVLLLLALLPSIVDAADLPAPEVIAEEILESLQSAVEEIQAVLDALNKK